MLGNVGVYYASALVALSALLGLSTLVSLPRLRSSRLVALRHLTAFGLLISGACLLMVFSAMLGIHLA